MSVSEKTGTREVALWFTRHMCEERCEEEARTAAIACTWGGSRLLVGHEEPAPAAAAPAGHGATDAPADPLAALEGKAASDDALSHADFSGASNAPAAPAAPPQAPAPAAPNIPAGVTAPAAVHATSAPAAASTTANPTAPNDLPLDDSDTEYDRQANFTSRTGTPVAKASCEVTIVNASDAPQKFTLKMRIGPDNVSVLEHPPSGSNERTRCASRKCRGTLGGQGTVSMVYEITSPTPADIECSGVISAADAEAGRNGFVVGSGTLTIQKDPPTAVPIVIGEGRPF